MSADTDTLPALPASILDVPLTFDLAPVINALEKAVPKRLGDITVRHAAPDNDRVHFAFEAVRQPFKLTMSGQTAFLVAEIEYMGRGWYNPPLAPEISASCGTNGVMPRARLELAAPLSLTPQWKLRSRTRVVRVEPVSTAERDQCEVTFLKIDVTGKVIGAARKALEERKAVVDDQVARIDVRSRFEGWWRSVAQPIRLTNGVWLEINPQSVQAGRISGQGRMLTANIGLAASPRIVTGPRPRALVRPLPPLSRDSVGGAFHALLEGVLDYRAASAILTDQLAGKRIQRGRHHVEVHHVRVYGIGGGKLALDVGFRGTTRGHIFFVGTPRYDARSDHLYVPDLEYDVASANLLVSGFEWLKHDDVRGFIRERARWPAGGLMTRARAQLLRGLNRELAPGVLLSGEVTGVRALGVHASRRAIIVRAAADGAARLDIRRGRRTSSP